MACEIEKMASNTDHRPLLATVLMYFHEIWKNMLDKRGNVYATS